MEPLSVRSRFRGVLLGTAVGDALGLPAEGVSRRRAARLFPPPWRHRLLPRRGMVSDDTEHTVFVAQSLLRHPDSAERFARRLGWSLRWWLVSLPAGVGFGTLRAVFRLWIGIRPSRSGVLTAGNGPAMRVAPIGAFFARSPQERSRYVLASTVITHTDPRAIVGAGAVARMVAWSIGSALGERPPLARFIDALKECGSDDPEWLDLTERIEEAARCDATVLELAERLGLGRGVTGYIYHTVPVVLYAWYRHFGDFEATLVSVLECGGDTDTTGAIAGALAGAVVGEGGIPQAWVRGISDWPRGVTLLRRLADGLAAASEDRAAARPVRYFWPGVIPRNALFLLVVLAHGLRRLAPPY